MSIGRRFDLRQPSSGLLLVPLMGACSAGDVEWLDADPSVKTVTPTLYLTLLTHTERDDQVDEVDYSDETTIQNAREYLVDMVRVILGDHDLNNTVESAPAAYNWQTDSSFALGLASHDPEDSLTGYTNVIDWMDQQGVEVSAHAHDDASSPDYAELAEILYILGNPGGSRAVGGFKYSGDEWLSYDGSATSTPWTWNVMYFTGGARCGHPTDGSSGVWYPSADTVYDTSCDEFRTEFTGGSPPTPPVIGGGPENTVGPIFNPFINDVVERQNIINGVVNQVEEICAAISTETEELWTHRIMIHQRYFDESADDPYEYIGIVADVIDAVNGACTDPAVDLVWATPLEIYDVWDNQYSFDNQHHAIDSCPVSPPPC